MVNDYRLVDNYSNGCDLNTSIWLIVRQELKSCIVGICQMHDWSKNNHGENIN